MSRNRIIAIMALGLVAAVVALAIWATRDPATKISGPPAKIRLGTIPAELSALIWIAEDRGYFLENGLDVTTSVYEAGAIAIKDFRADKLDMITAGEFVFVVNSFHRHDMKIIATIDGYDSLKVIARNDRGIERLSDLKGKRVGVLKGSQAEFCLARLLVLNGISSQDVQVVDLSPTQQISAIENGTIDAALAWEPYAQKLKDVLGGKAIGFPAQSGMELYWTLICREHMIKTRPLVLQRFLAALIQAEEFLAAKPAESKVITAKRLGSEMAYMDSIWKDNRFRVLLPQGLLLTMEDQARWLKSSGVINISETPDFLDFVYFHGLENLKPEAVTMIH